MGWADDFNRIELAADTAVAAIFAGALGFAVSGFAGEVGLGSLLVVVVVFRLVYRGLRRMAARADAPLFEVPAIEPAANKDVAAIPILRLVGSAGTHSTQSRTPPPDDSQALSDALAQLRRSMH